jgi:uncharacterized protein (TIGR02001 family)
MENMKPIRMATLITMILALLISASTGWAEEEKPSADGSLAFLSQYVWRGYGLSKDSLVIQPSATFAYKGFAFNIWGNLDTNFFPTDSSQFTETDLTLSWDKSFDKWNLGFGFIYYAFDGFGFDTEELYGTVGYDVILQPTLTVYRDYARDFKGWYILLGLSHSFPLPRGMSLDLAGSASYWIYDDIYEVNDPTKRYSNLHDGLLSASLAIPFAKYFTATPIISYAFPLSGAAGDLIAEGSLDGNDNHFYGGVSVSIAF